MYRRGCVGEMAGFAAGNGMSAREVRGKDAARGEREEQGASKGERRTSTGRRHMYMLIFFL